MDIRRMFTYDYNSNLGNDSCPTNEIWYTSSDGNVVTPYATNVFGANIVSNNYINGQGIISFDGPVTTIGMRAFRNCTNLSSVTIPNSVTEIGMDAFRGCSSLTSITIPDSVTSIGTYAFVQCPNLVEFTGKYVADGGRCLIIDNTIIAYAEASGTTYNIPNSVTMIGQSAFQGCSRLESITIPDSVTTIKMTAFAFCDSLTSVNIPNSVTTIGTGAIQSCTSLTSITIPDSVTEIGSNAFSNCSSLTSVTIGDSVTKTGNSTFYNCSSLTSVYCKATIPPMLGGTSVFDNNASARRIYVPTGSVNAYKSATNWSEYASVIVGYDF